MRDGGGGFFSTQDADSEGVEGKYYTWDLTEFQRVVGSDGELLSLYFDVSENGNFEEKNILNIPRSPEIFSKLNHLTEEELQNKVREARKRLYAVREKRVKPGRDEKILTDWNGLMLHAFADAAAYLDRADYRTVAESNAEFIWNTLWDGKQLLHNFKDGRARFNGYLDDYANFADGLFALYQLTFETRWLERAAAIADRMVDQFWDPANGGFFFTGREHESLVARNKDFFDNATPSGNSVACDVLLRMAAVLDRPDYRQKAETTFQAISDLVQQYGAGLGRMISAIDFYVGPSREVAIAGDPNDFLRILRQHYHPRTVVASGPETSAALLNNRPAIGGLPTAYVCENLSCRQPVTDPAQFEKQISEK
jgi:uncharacterized protein YyaL (SSP411 family)